MLPLEPIDRTLLKNENIREPVFGSRWTLSENATSLAVILVPSENLSPDLTRYAYVVGLTARQDAMAASGPVVG